MGLLSLPSSYRSQPVLPFAPNAAGDRPHDWTTAIDTHSTPAGLSVRSGHEAQGPETIQLRYVGLSRDDARTLEQFADDQHGEQSGFWCPSFQHDFIAVPHVSGSPSGAYVIRDAGYTANVWPLGDAYRQIAAFRYGVPGGHWLFAEWFAHNSFATEPVTGFQLSGFDLTGDTTAGNASVLDNTNTVNYATGLVVMRLLWVRLAAPVTTEWAHPRSASLTLSVVTDAIAAPST